MPPLTGVIQGYVAGDGLSVVRIVPNLPAGRTIVKAWMTVKLALTDPDPGAMQKIITTTSVPGEGQITAIGDGTGGQPVGTGALFFDVQSTDTAALGSTRVYEYDVKIKLDDGTPATLEIGTFRQLQGVTTATA